MSNKPILPQPDPDEDKKRREQRQKQLRTYVGYALTGLLILWFFQQFFLAPRTQQTSEITYSAFKQSLAAGQIITVVIGDSSLTGTMKNPQLSTPTNPVTNTIPFDAAFTAGDDPKLVEELQNAGVQFSFQRPPNPIGSFLLAYALPFLLLAGFWFVLSRRMGQGGAGGLGGIFNVGKSKATEVKPESIGVTYKDVGGADEAIAELQEIIQFLKTPEQFTALGGRIPKGVLLVGPPGTGKTLLAKATAGEASVPFFETSGSAFIEMFVGVGAARARSVCQSASGRAVDRLHRRN